MASPLQKEFDYYLGHQEELVAKFRGRVVAIKDQKVIGDYESDLAAVAAVQKLGHKLGSFLVQKVEPGSAGYTQTFHSRVAFN
jgi:hypothetical protein